MRFNEPSVGYSSRILKNGDVTLKLMFFNSLKIN